MAEPKTKPTDINPEDFIATLTDAKKRADALTLLEIFRAVTDEPAVMWGPSIIGFGRYSIPAGKTSNDWPLTGFSPRSASFTLYTMAGVSERPELMDGLGKYTTKGSCLHVKALKDIDPARLKAIIRCGYDTMKARHS